MVSQMKFSCLFVSVFNQLGTNVESITMVYDVEGLGLKHLWKPAIETYGEVQRHIQFNHRCRSAKTQSRLLGWLTSPNNVSVCHQILQMFEDNYPEGLKRLFVIKGEFVHPPKCVSVNKLFVIICLCSFYHYMLTRLSAIARLCFCNAFNFFSCSPKTLSCGLQPRQALSEWEHKTKDPYPRGWDTIPLSHFTQISKFNPIKTL